jgi:DNA-directed RNA polymerase specialized sigma24 family protein
MKIPKNMTKEEVMKTIDNIIKKIAPKYTFYGYDIDDIKQESFIICLDALERYDSNRPLENFLSVHLSNRLKNFIRDNNFTKCSDHKKNVLSPKQLPCQELVEDDYKPIMIEDKEILNMIDSNLPVHMREDYLKIINGVYCPKKRRKEIIDFIKDIVNEEDA